MVTGKSHSRVGDNNALAGLSGRDGESTGADEHISADASKIFSRLSSFSYSRSCPKKLKFGDIVGRLDLTYLKYINFFLIYLNFII